MYPLLYKYCSFKQDSQNGIVYDINNLQQDTLYFASPLTYNDPYEGAFGISTLDIIHAFCLAQLETNRETGITLEIVELAFNAINHLQSMGESIENLQITRKELFSLFEKFKAFGSLSPDNQVYFRLLNDDDYLRLFLSISEVQLPVAKYEEIVTHAVNKFSELSSPSKQYVIVNLTTRYSQKFTLVNTLRESMHIDVPILLIDALYTVKGSNDTTYIKFLKEQNQIFQDIFCKCKELPGKLYKTTCLSENPTSILMWSHYADRHQGFCVEYDFNKVPDENLRNCLKKVNYRDDMPMLSIKSLTQIFCKKFQCDYVKNPTITQQTSDTCLEAIITKNTVWQYEKEWRLVLNNLSGISIDKLPFATKLILGDKISDKNKIQLITVARAKNPPIPIYQAYLLPNKYEVGFYPITF